MREGTSSKRTTNGRTGGRPGAGNRDRDPRAEMAAAVAGGAGKKFLPSFPSLSALVGKKPSARVGKQCPLSGEGAPKIDYKNPKFLAKFVSERGKIIPSRITNISQKKQRELSIAIKRARYLGLLGYKNK
jgi:small subunit ribosomal protein S18